MDWFEKLTGFRELDYDETRARLSVAEGRLLSNVNGESYGVGVLELVSLHELRERTTAVDRSRGHPRVSVVNGDVRLMHQSPQYAGAMFQVASQFNLLEMIGPLVTPEDGVTRYQYDHTQGPACAIAAGAATIFRNYFAPVDGESGQRAGRQLDGLAEIGTALSESTGRSVSALWDMTNGYALADESGLQAISSLIRSSKPDHLDKLRAMLRIGVQWDVEVTETFGHRPTVSQAFCSALPVAYCGLPASKWEPFARLILEAAYEATLRAAIGNSDRGVSNTVLLTLLGGGSFGNDLSWILDAMQHALEAVNGFDLDVRIVSYGTPSSDVLRFAERNW